MIVRQYKKRIVNGKGHMLIYSLCLVLSAYHICRTIGWVTFWMVLATFLTRISLPRQYSSKYVLWALCRTSPWLLREAMPFVSAAALSFQTS